MQQEIIKDGFRWTDLDEHGKYQGERLSISPVHIPSFQKHTKSNGQPVSFIEKFWKHDLNI